MEDYFKKKLGENIQTKVTTGNDFYTEVYQRVYNVEVLRVSSGSMTVDVKSYDVAPSGLRDGDSSQALGETTIKIGTKTKTEIIDAIIREVDKPFFRRYPNVK